MIVIGVDQSLAASGIAVIRGTEVLHSSCTITAPGKTPKIRKGPPVKGRRLRKVSKAEDDGRRVDAVAMALVVAYRLAQDRAKAVLYKPQEDIVIAIEAPAGSQSAVSGKAMALAYAAMRGVCVALGVAPVVVPARDAKRALTGDPGAEKLDVVLAAEGRFGAGWEWGRVKGKLRPMREREAIADALAIARRVQLKGGA